MQPLAVEVDTAYLSDVLDFYADVTAADHTGASTSMDPIPDNDDGKDVDPVAGTKELTPEARHGRQWQAPTTGQSLWTLT
jgi:hypothetical protein